MSGAVPDIDHGDGTPQANRIRGNEAGLRRVCAAVDKAARR